MKYCDYCGEIHKKRDPCPVAITKTMSTRSNTVTAKLARAGSTGNVDDITNSLHTLSFEEREKRTLEAIEDVDAKIHLAELEERLSKLKEQRDSRRRRGAATPPGMASYLGADQDDAVNKCTLPPPSWREEQHQLDGHSDYSHSRRRSRDSRHRSRSRSDSSETRRRCSKWLLKRHTIGGKEVRKLNAYELIAASIMWCLDIPSLMTKDYRAFLEHLCL